LRDAHGVLTKLNSIKQKLLWRRVDEERSCWSKYLVQLAVNDRQEDWSFRLDRLQD
jgi:hypothetical protein